MMDCERYDANVFEVIDLINRDYPRGGIAQPGLTAGTCLRKDFAFSEERSNAPGMLLAVSRVNESVPLFLVEGLKRRLGGAGRSQGRGARAGVQGRHRRRARLARAQARSGCSSASWPTSRCTTRTSPRRRLASRRRRRRRSGGRGRQPRRVPRPADARRDRRARAAPTAWSSTPGTAGARRRCSPTPPSSPRSVTQRMSRVLVTGGAGTIGAAVVRRLLADPAYEVRVSDQRPAPQWMREGCEVHTGDLRVLEEARTAIERLHAGDPPGGDRRRDRQLPPAAAHADRGQQRALQRRDPRGAGRSRSSASCTSPPRWCSSAPRSSRRPRSTCRAARRRRRRTASRS